MLIVVCLLVISANGQSLNNSAIYSIKIEALQAESIVQEKSERIATQALDLIREANDSLSELLAVDDEAIDYVTLSSGVDYAIAEADRMVEISDYIFHNSRNRSSDVKKWSHDSVLENTRKNDEIDGDNEKDDEENLSESSADQDDNERSDDNDTQTDDDDDNKEDDEEGGKERDEEDDEIDDEEDDEEDDEVENDNDDDNDDDDDDDDDDEDNDDDGDDGDDDDDDDDDNDDKNDDDNEKRRAKRTSENSDDDDHADESEILNNSTTNSTTPSLHESSDNNIDDPDCIKTSPLEKIQSDKIIDLVDDIIELSYNITAVYGFVADLIIQSSNQSSEQFGLVFDANDSKIKISEASFSIRQAAEELREAERTAQGVAKQTDILTWA